MSTDDERGNRPDGWDQFNEAKISTEQRQQLEDIADASSSEYQAVAYGKAALCESPILPGLRNKALDQLLDEYRKVSK